MEKIGQTGRKEIGKVAEENGFDNARDGWPWCMVIRAKNKQKRGR